MPLTIKVPPQEFWDEKNEQFVYSDGGVLTLEHSLLSISKWESKWHKPYLNNPDKTQEEIMDYIRCMTITPHPDPNIYNCLSQENVNDIVKYIEDPMTATTIQDTRKKKSSGNDVVTSELIYYWMIGCQIPVQFEKWHINRLMTLIKVCDIKNDPHPQKLSREETLARQKNLNAQRRAKAKANAHH